MLRCMVGLLTQLTDGHAALRNESFVAQRQLYDEQRETIERSIGVHGDTRADGRRMPLTIRHGFRDSTAHRRCSSMYRLGLI